VDINLDTLKREVLDYLEASGFAIFRSAPGSLEGGPTVVWDAERYPDYRTYLETARNAGAKLIVFASREFEADEIEEALEELEDTDLPPEERLEYEQKLGRFRKFAGETCALELAFDYHTRLYVYEVHPDWYDDFMTIYEEVTSQVPFDDEEDEGGDSFGGYFSRN
jgi:hypothetical protein